MAGVNASVAAVAFLTLLWLVYLAVMSAHPAWLLTLLGPGPPMKSMPKAGAFTGYSPASVCGAWFL